MPSHRARDVTELLLAWNAGQSGALDRLVSLVYAELHRLAHRRMLGERPGHPLQTTALVHEAYLRLVDGSRIPWQNRAQFFAVAAQVMRRILVDAARARGARKRGGGLPHVSLADVPSLPSAGATDLIALDEALDALATLDPRKARVVELRYFAGLGVDETAEVLRVSPDTVTRDWKMARLWLLRELKRGAVTEARRH
jgi:RNA polymerase sigma factor (TIGR02999 family)